MREDIIKEWFASWFHPEWRKFDEVFEKDVYYSESWGPEYHGIEEIQEWFINWHKHSKLQKWEITKFHHIENTSVVEWSFGSKACNEEEDDFDGVSIIEWGENHKIKSLKEFCSSLPKYTPSTK